MSVEIRKTIEKQWNDYLSKYGSLFSSDTLDGSSPPSVFVGTYNYPKVNVGPMVPPIHGDTTILDSPERWVGKTLEEIINYRLKLVRGVQKIPVQNPTGRYIENLQDVAMSQKSTDSEITFEKATKPTTFIDGYSAPFGPVGNIKSAKFSNNSTERQIEKIYYDRDLLANDAVLKLYHSGIEISKIQRCFSIGMMGHKRRLVPTRWSITATDHIISSSLVHQILDAPVIDSHRVFFFEHIGNLFSIILFPHRWLYEMIEAWHSNGVLGFGSDHEDAKGRAPPSAIAGAYFAAKLAVSEYLTKHQVQAGVLILREIRPEYAIPVGVWQIREGIREALKLPCIVCDSFEDSLNVACKPLSVSKKEWISKGVMYDLIKQRTISDFLV